MSVLCARDIAACHSIIMTTKLIVSFLVEVISMRVKEVSTRQYVEVIIVILTWSVLDLLPSKLSDPRDLLLLLVHRIFSLRHSREVLIVHMLNLRTILLKFLESINLLRRWWLSLIFELSISKTILILV